MSELNPWGPISSTMYELNDSDLVERSIGFTGHTIQWPTLAENGAGYSHKTRIRAYKPVINEFFESLNDEQKGIFSQNIVRGLWPSLTEETKQTLTDRLSGIGWKLDEIGTLSTFDALLSEQFFPAGTPYDAYVAIRDIFETTRKNIVIVDPYVGGSIFQMLTCIRAEQCSVKILTMQRNLTADFELELEKFKNQYPHFKFVIQDQSDFHDRFIVIDETNFYHVGASIKDAGKRAFIISRLEDDHAIKGVKEHIVNAFADNR